MSKIAQSVMQLVAPIAEGFGLEVVEVVYEKKNDGMNLTIYIDKVGGVDINDCEKLHRAIDEPLDSLDPIQGPYILNVSSLGLDRPIKTDRDFARNMGKVVTVKLYKPDSAGNKKYTGTLVDYNADTFTIDTQSTQHTFERSAVAHVELHIEF